MLGTVVDCCTNECIDCKEYAAIRRDELRLAYEQSSQTSIK
jgi:hypothetical protein